MDKAKLYQDMLNKGLVKSKAEISRKYSISRARVTQIMNLNKLPIDLVNKIKTDPVNYSERALRYKYS